MLEKDLAPYIGRRPVGEIAASELLAALRKVEARGAVETAHRARMLAGQVFRYAIATGRAERNPAADLVGALAQPQGEHFASMTEPDQVAPLLRALYGYQGTPAVMAALKLAPLVFVRSNTLSDRTVSDCTARHRMHRHTPQRARSGRVVVACVAVAARPAQGWSISRPTFPSRPRPGRRGHAPGRWR